MSACDLWLSVFQLLNSTALFNLKLVSLLASALVLVRFRVSRPTPRLVGVYM